GGPAECSGMVIKTIATRHRSAAAHEYSTRSTRHGNRNCGCVFDRSIDGDNFRYASRATTGRERRKAACRKSAAALEWYSLYPKRISACHLQHSAARVEIKSHKRRVSS